MKRLFLFLIILISLLAFVGCGNKVDDEALQKISEALKNRWAYTDAIGDTGTMEEVRNATQEELDVLTEYSADDFKDFSLYVLYDDYRRELNDALFKLELAETNPDNIGNEWSEHLERRAKILHDIDSEYELVLSEEDRPIFEEVLTNSERLVNIEEIKEKLSGISGIDDTEITLEEKSIAISFPTESALSSNSFVSQKTGFPDKAMEILTVISEYDYNDIVISTTNLETIAISSYFSKESLNNLNFERWEDLESYDAHKFYGYTDAYHIRLGIWEELDKDIQQLIGNMNKDNSNEFWNRYGFTH